MSAPLRYQPFYCEENILHLCQDERFVGRSPAAVFIVGSAGGCAMWEQRAALPADAPIVWDYHVVLLVRDPWEIWDLDTTLACPTAAATYLDRSFRPQIARPRSLMPKLRVVDARHLVATFASDRSHMRRPDGTFQYPPPPWPPPKPQGGVSSNLQRFLTLDDPIAGEVLDLAALMRRVHVP